MKISERVASRYIQSYRQPASELPGVSTFTTEDSKKNLPGDTSKPSKDQEKYRPSEPPHRERSLPLPKDHTDGRVRTTPGNTSFNGPPATNKNDGDEVSIRTPGTPGEQYGHPYSNSNSIGRRPLNAFRLFPSTLEKQKEQRGKAKLESKKWYEQHKGKHQAEARRRYDQKKRDPNFKRRKKYYQEYPERYERTTGSGVSDPAERTKEWREKNKEAMMERESAGQRQKWRSPSERKKDQMRYRKDKIKRRRKSKEYRRKNKSRLKQYRKKVKNLNRKRVGPKPKSKKYSMDIQNINKFPFAFKSGDDYYFGFVKDLDIEQWEIRFFLENYGVRTWGLDSFLDRALFYRDEDLDEFYDLLDSAVEAEEEETDFDVDVEHYDPKDPTYQYVPMEKLSFDGTFYREQTSPRNLEQNNDSKPTGVPRGDQIYPKYEGTNTWIVPQTGQPYDQEPRDNKTPSEKPDFGEVTNNPGSAKVIPEGHGFENKKAKLIHEITDRIDRDIEKRSRDVRVRLSSRRPGSNVWSFQANDHKVFLWARPKEGQEKVAEADIKVNCSCGFWRYQGPEYWAKTGGYLMGIPKGKATPPKAKDPSGRNRVCKHVIAVFREVSKQNVGKYRFSSHDDTMGLRYLSDRMSSYRVTQTIKGVVMGKNADWFRKTLPQSVDVPKVPGWGLSTVKSPEYILYTKKYGNHYLQIKIMDLFGSPIFDAFLSGTVNNRQKVFFHDQGKPLRDLKYVEYWLKKYEIKAEQYIRDEDPSLAKQLRLAENSMKRDKSGCGDDVVGNGDDMFAGRSWKGPSSGYGKEYRSKNGPGKWEPASMGSGRHEEECQGYGLGGTKDCYNTKATGGRLKSKIGPVRSDADKKEYNKKYRKKRWPDKYKKASQKEAALRSMLIKLAYDNKEVRPHLLPMLKEAAQFDPQLTVFNRQWPHYSAMSTIVGNVNTYGKSTFVGTGPGRITLPQARALASKKFVDMAQGPGGWQVDITPEGWRYYNLAQSAFMEI